MNNKEKILQLKEMRDILIFLKNDYDNKKNDVADEYEKENVKKLVLEKKFYGKKLKLG